MKIKLLTAGIIAATLMTACSSSSSNKTDTDVINLDNVKKVLDTNADIALAAYNDSVATAELLDTAIDAFTANPTTTTLQAAKDAWLVAREPYGQTEVYRFRNSPIDSTNYADEDGPEGEINAWPLGENLIDYVKTGSDFGDDQLNGAPGTGETAIDLGAATTIISSTADITVDFISGFASGNDVIAGYHAIEFMLWGQDLNDDGSADTDVDGDKRDATGGNRPVTDFTTGASGDADGVTAASRRKKYLEIVSEKLISDLKTVRDGWKDDASYRTAFTTIDNRADAVEKITEILTGMGTLSEGELAGERMQIAFTSDSQEDEHSCFSDNTHRDIWLNAEGVSNSFTGEYAGYDSTLDGVDNETSNAVSGYGLDDYISDLGIASVTALSVELTTALAATKAGYVAIDDSARNNNTPVDNLIQGNLTATNPMYITIAALNAQSKTIEKLAAALDITDDVTDDDGSACSTDTPNEACPG